MSKFKTADAKQRERAVSDRTARGLQFLNPEMGFETFVAQDGDNSIRIVPPLSDDKDGKLWGIDVYAYYVNGRSFLSPRTFDPNATDPFKDMYDKLKQEDPEAAKAFKGSKRSLTFVLDMMDDEKLKIFSAPPTVIDEILKVSKNRRTGELIPVEDPKDGRIIFFNKSGQGIQTRYGAFSLDTESCVLDDSIADQLVHFRDLLIVPTAEELLEVLANMNTENTENTETSRPTARTRRNPESQSQPTQEVETEMVDEEIPKTTNRTRVASKEAPTASPEPTSSSSDSLKARVAARMAARQKDAS